MFRLVGKDLRILSRSRLLVLTLILYPALVALLIGLALSRPPEQPKIAIVNNIPRDVPVTTLAGSTIDPAAVGDALAIAAGERRHRVARALLEAGERQHAAHRIGR